ncbi:MAG: DNA-deoxyinosine glycosylase [Clostridiales bacterium]|nr:DNA-deoxyinosine glycosylase [Clostridiales bacterium]
MNRVEHIFDPVYDENSQILILGTIPSPKSREYGFYYGHPQNRFWRIMSDVMRAPLPNTIEEKKNFLLRHRIALWDVLASCDITGAKDSSIRNAVANDFSEILSASCIAAIFTTGMKATNLYQQLCYPRTNVPSTYLPSTSPANCGNFTYDELVSEYSRIRNYLK